MDRFLQFCMVFAGVLLLARVIANVIYELCNRRQSKGRANNETP